MLKGVLEGISKILNDGLTCKGPEETAPYDVPRAYVQSAKAMLEGVIKELDKKPLEIMPPDDIQIEVDRQGSKLDAGAQAAKRELLHGSE